MQQDDKLRYFALARSALGFPLGGSWQAEGLTDEGLYAIKYETFS